MEEVEYRFKDGREVTELPATRKTMSPLSLIVDAFEKLAKLVNSINGGGDCKTDLRLDTFCEACSLVSVLFSCLGLAFKFAEMEYVSKVDRPSSIFILILISLAAVYFGSIPINQL